MANTPQPTNTICQICALPFEKKDVVVQFMRWDNAPEGIMWSHLDCLYYASRTEEHRKHPPTVP